MLAIIKNNIRILLSKKGLLFSLLVLPLLLISFGLAQNPSGSIAMKVGIEDQDQTLISEALIEEIKSSGHQVVALTEDPGLMVVDQEIDMLITIAKGFEGDLLQNNKPKVSIRSLKGQEVTAILESKIDIYLSALHQLMMVEELPAAEELLRVYESITEEGYKLSVVKPEHQVNRGLEAGGAFLLYILSVNMLLVGRLILIDKSLNTLDRVRRAPVKRSQYLLANVLTGLFFLLINLLCIYLLASFLFNMSIGPEIYLVWIIFGVVWILIGIFLALISKSRRIHANALTIITVIAAMLGGSFWPINYAPEIMQKLAQITPHYWANQWASSVQQGVGVLQKPQFFLGLLSFVVIFFALSIFSLVRRKNTETFV